MNPVCQACGTTIEPSRGGLPRKWCSERCRKSQYAGTCEVCGNPTNGYNGYVTAAAVCRDCLCSEADGERAEVVSLWNTGLSEPEIADRLGVTREYVRARIQVARQKGDDVRLHRARNRTHWEEIERRWLAGESRAEIAAATGIKVSRVDGRLQNMRKAGIPLPKRRKEEPSQ